MLNGFGAQNTIDELRRRLRQQYGVRILHFDADVSKSADCRAMVRYAQEEFGGIDILVNNAGIQHVAPVEDFPNERWDAILATNLSAAFYLTAAVLPDMRAHSWGRIINIASVHGLVGSKHKSAYVTAKHGLVGLTKVVALETASQGITCNAICPGWVLTGIVEAQVTERMKNDNLDRTEAEHRLLSEKQPSGKFTDPKQIGALVCFLCSSSANNITGASLPVDGAWTAQ